MADNTVESLRVLQIGVEAVAAVGAITLGAEQTAGKTLHIGDITYTWVAVVDFNAPGELTVGTNLATQKAALITALNGTDNVNPPNPYVTAGTFSGDILPITARIPGPIGNSIVFTLPTPVALNSINGAGHLGGTTAGAHAHGTPVAATTRLAVESMDFPNGMEKLYNPKVQNGTRTRYRGAGVPVEHGAEFTLKDQAAIWDHFILWLSGMWGGPTVTAPDGLGGDYVCKWVVAQDATPDPYSFTIERRYDTGLGGTVDRNATYCMLPDWQLQFALNEELKMGGSGGFGRAWTEMMSGITAGQSLPDFETGVSSLSSAYSDDLFANVGDTQLGEVVIGWTLKFMSGIFARFTAEGRTDLSFTKHQFEVSAVDLDLTLLLDPDRYAIEETRANDPALNRFSNRILVTGSNGRELAIDMVMQHTAPLPPLGADKGADVVTYNLAENPDGTNFMEITLTLPYIPTLT